MKSQTYQPFLITFNELSEIAAEPFTERTALKFHIIYNPFLNFENSWLNSFLCVRALCSFKILSLVPTVAKYRKVMAELIATISGSRIESVKKCKCQAEIFHVCFKC